MKYEFIKNGVDDYTLKYKDKEIKFHSTVGIVSRLQESIKNARLKMVLDLTKQGISIKELTKEIKENGKTYYDNTNKDELEKIYLQEEQTKIFQEIIKEMFDKTIEELIIEIGLETEEEISTFSTQLGKVIIGQFPSK